MSRRARDLVAKGLLPIVEEHVLREPRVRTNEETARAVPMVGGAGAGARDRARTGKSLRARKAEKAAQRAADLCPDWLAASRANAETRANDRTTSMPS